MYLGMSPGKLRRLTQCGELAIIQHDDCSPWLYDIDDLDSHIEKSKRKLSDFSYCDPSARLVSTSKEKYGS